MTQTPSPLTTDSLTPPKSGTSAVFATWLLVASVSMLFIGLFAAYAMFRMDKPGDFQRDGAMLAKQTGVAIAAVMLGSALAASLGAWALRVGRAGICQFGLLIALLGGVFVLSMAGRQALRSVEHLTLVARVSTNPADGNYLYDGEASWRSDAIEINGQRVLLPTERRVDLHWLLPNDLPRLVEPAPTVQTGDFVVPMADIDQHSSYFAGRNTFFACYYVTALLLCVCVIGGMIATAAGLVGARRKAEGLTAGLGIYWSFLTVVWIVILQLFYFS